MGQFWLSRRTSSESPEHSESERSSVSNDIEADRPLRTAPSTSSPPCITTSDDQTALYRYRSGRIYALLTGNSNSSTTTEPYLKFVHADLKRMQEALEWCHIEVRNTFLEKGSLFLTRQKLFDDVMKSAERCVVENKFSCFIFYFTGHGNNTGIILYNGEVATYDEIIQYFIVAIGDIPKIFIFDCCRLTADSKKSFTDAALPANCYVVFACMDDSKAWGHNTTLHTS